MPKDELLIAFLSDSFRMLSFGVLRTHARTHKRKHTIFVKCLLVLNIICAVSNELVRKKETSYSRAGTWTLIEAVMIRSV